MGGKLKIKLSVADKPTQNYKTEKHHKCCISFNPIVSITTCPHKGVILTLF